jgi:hypothetical protein
MKTIAATGFALVMSACGGTVESSGGPEPPIPYIETVDAAAARCVPMPGIGPCDGGAAYSCRGQGGALPWGPSATCIQASEVWSGTDLAATFCCK